MDGRDDFQFNAVAVAAAGRAGAISQKRLPSSHQT